MKGMSIVDVVGVIILILCCYSVTVRKLDRIEKKVDIIVSAIATEE